MRDKIAEFLCDNSMIQVPYKYVGGELREQLRQQADAILTLIASEAEKGMPICPPMHDREDVVVSIYNQRQSDIDWIQRQCE